MALKTEVVEATLAAARANNIEPAALLAVVEIESAGNPLEQDGRTPRFLFEKHKFNAELKAQVARDPGAKGKLADAQRAGLVHSGWSPGSQYAGQETSAGRLNILKEACAIDKECAFSACSWGLGQIMGSNAESLGYPSAIDMVEAMHRGGIQAQVDCMVRYVRSRKLDKALARRDWRAFAAGYNGSGYEKNAYHTKLAAAYAKWKQRAPDDPAPVRPAPTKEADVFQMGDSGAMVLAFQQRLNALGYFVGAEDSKFAERTRAAVLAFQVQNGLVTDGRVGPKTRAALNSPDARPMPLGDRANVTAQDLAAQGSGTIVDANTAQTAGGLLVGVSAAKGVQDSFDVLGAAQSWVTDLTSIRTVVDPLIVIVKWALQMWWLAAIVVGIIVIQKTGAIKVARVLAARLGKHIGR